MKLMHVVVIIATLAVASSTRFTLNVPQVLLPLVPPSGVRANFTLTADKGCFRWCASIRSMLESSVMFYHTGLVQSRI